MNNKQNKLLKQAILWLSAFALICSIYFLSGQEGAVSHRLSRGVAREAGTLLELPGFLRDWGLSLRMGYDHIFRKAAHFSLFFILAVLLYLAIRNHVKKYAKTLSLVFCMLFAFSDEYHQKFIMGRTALYTDVIIDIAGAICGMAFVRVSAGIRRIFRK